MEGGTSFSDEAHIIICDGAHVVKQLQFPT